MNITYRILGKKGRITIPYEIRKKVGFAYNDVLSFTESPDGKSVKIKREKICNNCRDSHINSENISLLEFLDGLTEKEQQAAIVYLSTRWAEKQGVKFNV